MVGSLLPNVPPGVTSLPSTLCTQAVAPFDLLGVLSLAVEPSCVLASTTVCSPVRLTFLLGCAALTPSLLCDAVLSTCLGVLFGF